MRPELLDEGRRRDLGQRPREWTPVVADWEPIRMPPVAREHFSTTGLGRLRLLDRFRRANWRRLEQLRQLAARRRGGSDGR